MQGMVNREYARLPGVSKPPFPPCGIIEK
jgi:hypothetical protein